MNGMSGKMAHAQTHVVTEQGPTPEQKRWKQHMTVQNVLDHQVLPKVVRLRNAQVICIYIKMY